VPPSHLWASPMGNSPRQTVPLQAPSKAGLNLGTAGGGSGSGSAVPFTGRRETGFSPERERPHHSVLPSDASPVESVGFANDAFRPLWDKEPKSPWAGFHAAAAPAKTT
jgi:hypothetical protein